MEDFNDLYSVKSEAKSILLQISKYITKFNKLSQDKFEKAQIIEVIGKICNDDFIRMLNKFCSIVEKKDVGNKPKVKSEKSKIEVEIMNMKENSEMFVKRKKEIEIIKEMFIHISNENIGMIKEGDEIKTDENISIMDENEEIIDTNSKKNKAKYENSPLNTIFSKCYICKNLLTEIHHFYSSMCIKCGNINYKIRELKFDLKGRIAIVTGARVKIGYQTALQLLRANCKVIATSRFPKDALSRYMKELDFNEFKDNLVIYPLDLRMFKSIDTFLIYIQNNYTHVDILINNAAQTIRRSANYYNYLIEIETKELSQDLEKMIINPKLNKKINQLELELENNQIVNLNINSEILNKFSNLPDSVIFSQKELIGEYTSISDPNILGVDLQPIDFSNKSSWSFQLDDINFIEFAEVQLINCWAPFYLCKNIKKLMEKSPNPDRYIINVTGAEGFFYAKKYTIHPHTNMGKASLNMMTHTCGNYYKKFGIYMNCVDTGWVSCMQEFGSLFNDDANLSQSDFETFYTNIPLDDLDAAMRIIHPILEGILYDNYIAGCLFRNYKVEDW